MFPASRSARKRYGSQWHRQHNNQKPVTQWRNLPQATKDLWAEFAATFPQPSKRDPNVFLNGYQLFIKRNSYCFLNHGINTDFMLEPEFIEIPPGTVDISLRSSNAVIDATELYIKNFGILPQVGDYVIMYAHMYGEYSGQFFQPITQVLEVEEIFADGFFISVSVPEEMNNVTISVYLSKVFHQSVTYPGTKCRYMGCFTKKTFISLSDTPASYEGQAGKVPIVNASEDGLIFSDSLPSQINVVNNYTELTNITNNYTVFDINTQMFYTYINETWVNITLNLNLVSIVNDYTTLVNVVNNTVVFDLTTNNFYKYDVDVWVQIGGGGDSFDCSMLLDCLVITGLIDAVILNLETSVPVLHFGSLYNFYTVISSDPITSSDDWSVPTIAQWNSFRNYVGWSAVYAIKENNSDYWDQYQLNTNTLKFFSRGSGNRQPSGNYGQLRSIAYMWSSEYGYGDYARAYRIRDGSGNFEPVNLFATYGCPIRLMRPAPGISDGTIGSYSGNDGKFYRTTVINEKEYLADNLAETKLRSGADIPNITDNTEWGAATTPAFCFYDNDETNR